MSLYQMNVNNSPLYLTDQDVFIDNMYPSYLIDQIFNYEDDKLILLDGEIHYQSMGGAYKLFTIYNDKSDNFFEYVKFNFYNAQLSRTNYLNLAIYDNYSRLLYGCITAGERIIKLPSKCYLRISFSTNGGILNFPRVYLGANQFELNKFFIQDNILSSDLYDLITLRPENNNILYLGHYYLDKTENSIVSTNFTNLYYYYARRGQRIRFHTAYRSSYAGSGFFTNIPIEGAIAKYVYPFEEAEIEIVEDGYFVISGDVNDEGLLYIQTFEPLSIKNRLEVIENEKTTDFSKYSWNAIGDSVTQNAKYMGVVKSLLNLNFSNYGLGSCTIAMNNTYLQNKSIVERVCGLNGNTPISDADIWTINGGLNDCLYNSQIGELATYNSNFDITTVYGALQKIVEYVLSLRAQPNLLLLEPEQSNRDGWSEQQYPTTMQKIREVFRNVGAYYSIPVLKLGENCGISLYNCQRSVNPTTRDGVHLSDLGASMMGKAVAKGIKDLMMFSE